MRRTTSQGRRRDAKKEVDGKQINLLISASEHKAFKMYALEHDTSMSHLLSEWINEHVWDEHANQKEAGA